MSTQIALPRDAEGREIPLDTEVLYNKDGNELCTDRVTYMRLTKDWWFFGHFRSRTDTHRIAASNLYLTPPDNREKLKQDALKNPCKYFGRRDNYDSVKCDGLSCVKCPYCDMGQTVKLWFLIGDNRTTADWVDFVTTDPSNRDCLCNVYVCPQCGRVVVLDTKG